MLRTVNIFLLLVLASFLIGLAHPRAPPQLPMEYRKTTDCIIRTPEGWKEGPCGTAPRHSTSRSAGRLSHTLQMLSDLYNSILAAFESARQYMQNLKLEREPSRLLRFG
ncbi:c6.1 [Ichnoviriform fugitivi]|uniref:C6.1 n=1 Tax=Ichnoviriform fugitivi TaxID=265522 RepID=A2Q0G8_9VIRU|nr:c6.1 [Ichnoviriform fugitivi]BAF45683.1 c6.1 [Ichnoviriform fugitivi]